MTVTLVLDFYDDRTSWQVSGGGIFHGGTNGTEKFAISQAREDMIQVEKDPDTLKIVRNEHRKKATLENWFVKKRNRK